MPEEAPAVIGTQDIKPAVSDCNTEVPVAGEVAGKVYTVLPEALKTALLNQVYYLYDNRSVGVDDISPIAKIILNLYKRV